MESLIKEVKARTDIIKIAQYYGLKLDRSNKCICPFHKEKTPSLSISQSKQIWHCFGCDKGGDSISLVAELLNVNALEAAKSINQNLGLGIAPNQKASSFEINKYKKKMELEEAFKKWESKTFGLLCDYLHLLWKWEKEELPDSDLYIEAMHNRDYIDYLIDEIFINGTDQDKIWFWKKQKKVVSRIESRINTFRTIDE